VRNVLSAEIMAQWTFFVGRFTLHIPVPLVDLTGFEAQALLKLNYLGFLPVGVLLELNHEDLVLLTIFSEALLCFLCTLDSVTNDYAWDRSILHSSRLVVCRVLASALNGVIHASAQSLKPGIFVRH